MRTPKKTTLLYGIKAATAAALLGLVGCTAPVHDVREEEPTVQSTMQTWARGHGKELRWDIDDMSMADKTALERLLNTETDLGRAVEKLLSAMEVSRQAHARATGKVLRPVEACIYTNVIHITYKNPIALPCSGAAAGSRNY